MEYIQYRSGNEYFPFKGDSIVVIIGDFVFDSISFDAQTFPNPENVRR